MVCIKLHRLCYTGGGAILNAPVHIVVQEGSYDEAIAGCDAVIHTASPYKLAVSPGKEREELIDPALKGTTNILGMLQPGYLTPMPPIIKVFMLCSLRTLLVSILLLTSDLLCCLQPRSTVLHP